MSCHRCDGFMVVDECSDCRDDSGQFCFEAWRCLSCGEILDAVILANRRRRHESRTVGVQV